MACDNGRRKELNLIKRTKGFNWSPEGVVMCFLEGPIASRRPDGCWCTGAFSG